MNIGRYSFQEYCDLVQAFHGYPAPGVLIGGYMVTAVQQRLPDGILYDAVCETRSCLPDAIQLLTPCSVGNGWLRVLHFGRYALSLYDKYTGEGWRIFLDVEKLEAWPEIKTWFFKLKPKKEQDSPKAIPGNRSCRRLYLRSRADTDAAAIFGAAQHRQDCGLPPMSGSLPSGRWQPLPRLPGRKAVYWTRFGNHRRNLRIFPL